jgi:hypothetical protein
MAAPWTVVTYLPPWRPDTCSQPGDEGFRGARGAASRRHIHVYDSLPT